MEVRDAGETKISGHEQTWISREFPEAFLQSVSRMKQKGRGAGGNSASMPVQDFLWYWSVQQIRYVDFTVYLMRPDLIP